MPHLAHQSLGVLEEWYTQSKERRSASRAADTVAVVVNSRFMNIDNFVV